MKSYPTSWCSMGGLALIFLILSAATMFGPHAPRLVDVTFFLMGVFAFVNGVLLHRLENRIAALEKPSPVKSEQE